MDEKLRKLNDLNKNLKPPKELSGVFLPKESPKQFDFMFIAEMPSKGMPKNWDGKTNFNFDVSKRDKFLQALMVRYDVAGSYVTDVVKEREKPGEPKKEKIQKWLSFLLEEIKIIQPKIVVVLGERTYKKSFKPFVESLIPREIKINWVYHYRQQGAKTDSEVEQRFSEVISKMRNDE